MGTYGHLDLDAGDKSVDQKVYRSMIGSLLYLCASRPNIMLSVCMCVRFQADPKEVHLRAVNWILRYLVHTPKFGLWYPKGSTFDLLGYSDADWAGCKIDRKSTSGTYQFLGRSLVSWASKKQNSVALSTAEAEYIVAGHCCAQLLWMRQTLRDYGYKLTKVPLLCDNESAIRMADNPVKHSCTKHIAILYHFLRDHQQRGDIVIAYVSTKEQLVDIFTKPLDEKTFTKLRNELNILDSRNFDWYLAHIAHLYLWSYLFHVLWLMCFQVYFMTSYRLKGKWSLRRRQGFHSTPCYLPFAVTPHRSPLWYNPSLIYYLPKGERVWKGL
jgi:hypothetical protein